MAAVPQNNDDVSINNMRNECQNGIDMTGTVHTDILGLQSNLPAVMKGATATNFSNSLTLWLDGVTKVKLGLQELLIALGGAQRKSDHTDNNNAVRARVQTPVPAW